jgi:ParB/RepB/Spo0J family partition protein
LNSHNIVMVKLSRIDQNPYQTRSREDPEHLAMVRESIKANGLKQLPIGRVIPEKKRDEGVSMIMQAQSLDYQIHHSWVRVQIAAGNTRLRAFEQLHVYDPKDDRWTHMPIIIQDLTDLEMFEAAVIENQHRKNLDPIETARAMLTYRDLFGKTSGDIGALWGISDSYVRQFIRLLNLPEPVQQHVSAGKLSQNTARKLLSAQTVLGTEKVAETAKTLMSKPELSEADIDEAIRNRLNAAKSAHCMWEGWRGDQDSPRGGPSLWVLKSWTLDPSDLQNGKGEKVLNKFSETDVKSPPACVKCPFYLRLQGNHYCGFKPCWELKKKVWQEKELDNVSKDLGIPVYDPRSDGEDYESAVRSRYEKHPETGWGHKDTEYVQWFEEKADHLRLRKAPSGYQDYDFTGSKHIELISVRDELKGTAQQAREEAARQKEAEAAQKDQIKTANRNRDLSKIWLWEVGSQLLSNAWNSLNRGELIVILRTFVNGWELANYDIPEDPTEAHRFRRRILAHRVLEEAAGWAELSLGPEHIASIVKGLAVELGVEVPADIVEQAKSWEPKGDDPEDSDRVTAVTPSAGGGTSLVLAKLGGDVLQVSYNAMGYPLASLCICGHALIMHGVDGCEDCVCEFFELESVTAVTEDIEA